MMEKLKKLGKVLCHRVVFIVLAMLVQLTALILVNVSFVQYSVFFYIGNTLLAIVLCIKILYDDSNPSYKIVWLVPIMLFPIAGTTIYLLFSKVKFSPKNTALRKSVRQHYLASLQNGVSVERALTAGERDSADKQAQYLQRYGNAPLYQNLYTAYFPLGEDKFSSMVTELERAKHFIFLEYFIIEEGIMWDTILDILVRKAKEGVEVRVLYDDMGCLFTLPGGYYKKLQGLGIKARACNTFIPVLSSRFNNRDHRKILVIDGHTGYTGGINLADEYINAYEKHGHWKDCAVMIKGPAVESLTAMFLSFWDTEERIEEDFTLYGYQRYCAELTLPKKDGGFLAPYSSSPLDDELVGENVYLNIISHASDYIYINTPYLIIDHELVVALENAAKQGVDVRIVTPHVADKWYVHLVTQSYYPSLIKAGVKIYEYAPGFIHAKTFLADDCVGTVGTVNLDYRSLYLHFECGVWMYRTDCLSDMKRDYEETLGRCILITKKEMDACPLWKKLLRPILRLFAPLM